MTVQPGLDLLLSDAARALEGARVGLITNHSGVDRALRSTADRLHEHPSITLAALFGPEHGIRGEVQDTLAVRHSRDPRTNLPVHSLFGETMRPTAEMLRGLDVLVFDIQDVGVRFYTYATTLLLTQEVAAEHGLPVFVLDRPNPITGTRIEGPLLDSRFESFLGLHRTPIRHGMTVGELARLAARERGWPEPTVFRSHAWHRDQWFDQTGLPWVMPSPNLPTLETATLYPGTCLVEGTNASEGRGTTRPFEILGAPWLDPFRLADDLNGREIPGVAFRPLYFTPTFWKHANVSCGGVQVHILDREVIQAVALGLQVVQAIRSQLPETFEWTRSPDGRFLIDLLAGSDEPRKAIEAGANVGEIVSTWEGSLRDFEQHRQAALLYQ